MMSFASNVRHLTLGEGEYNNIHGNYIVHNTFCEQRRPHEEIGDGPGSLSILEPTSKRCRREEVSEDGIKVIHNKDLKLTLEIGSGPGYFLHAGETKGRAVIVKVFNPGPTVRKHLESTVTLSKGFMHPNVLRIEGVSSPASLTQFIAYENAFWKTAEGPLAVALKDDLTRSITLGFKMIAGLSAGMNHLIIHGVPLASLGVENFDIFLDVDDRFLISINPRIPAEAGTTNGEQPENNTNRSWDVFNAICQKVLRSANRLLHDEDIDRNPASMEPTRHPSVLQQISALPPLQSSEPLSSENLFEGEAPVPPRREYVWRTIDRGQQSLATIGNQIARELDLKLSSVNKFAWTDDRSPHRCAGYVREEITLATTIADSAVVSYDAPSPLEICSVCREIIGVQEEFRCICGDTNPGSRPTGKCQECKIWSHSDCVGNSKEFICQFCSIGQATSRRTVGGDKSHQNGLPSLEELAVASTSTPSLKRSQSSSTDSKSLREPSPIREPRRMDVKKNKKEAARIQREAEKQRRALAEKMLLEQARAVMQKRNQMTQNGRQFEWDGPTQQARSVRNAPNLPKNSAKAVMVPNISGRDTSLRPFRGLRRLARSLFVTAGV
ncbi:hypothetical protein FB451DRAFT_1556124 [Mycena latifolia]|nr:hypothetical protein FB451DRAFT_1556124 [Mycena latifolia]